MAQLIDGKLISQQIKDELKEEVAQFKAEGIDLGEAMAVMMVAGNSPNMPDSLFRSVTLLTTAIAKEMSYAGGLQRQALFSIALVLFVFIMLINVVLNVVLKGGNRDE